MSLLRLRPPRHRLLLDPGEGAEVQRVHQFAPAGLRRNQPARKLLHHEAVAVDGLVGGVVVQGFHGSDGTRSRCRAMTAIGHASCARCLKILFRVSLCARRDRSPHLREPRYDRASTEMVWSGWSCRPGRSRQVRRRRDACGRFGIACVRIDSRVSRSVAASNSAAVPLAPRLHPFDQLGRGGGVGDPVDHIR